MTEIYKNDECTIHVETEGTKRIFAWVDDGQTAFYVRPSEIDMFRFDPQRALQFMRHKIKKGIYRCSHCGWEGKREEFIRGHFAALLCVACNDDYHNRIATDIKTKNLCHKCGEPRSICSC
jgi:ribosomal protein L37AE/L43A